MSVIVVVLVVVIVLVGGLHGLIHKEKLETMKGYASELM